METVAEARRLRLSFEDLRILSKAQRKGGLMRSWILLKPQLPQTISELSSHIIDIFHLQNSCPHGLVLSMDGFVLPPFESICLLKDEDVISVEKKPGQCNDLSTAVGGVDSFGEVQLLDKPVDMGVKLLTNEEFDKVTGGYESELEESDLRSENEQLRVEDTPQENVVSKKRKALQKPPSSKKKKRKRSCMEESPLVIEQVTVKKRGDSKHKRNKTKKVAVEDELQEHDACIEQEKLSMDEIDERSGSDDCYTPKEDSIMFDASQASNGAKKVNGSQKIEKGEGNKDATQGSDGAKKNCDLDALKHSIYNDLHFIMSYLKGLNLLKNQMPSHRKQEDFLSAFACLGPSRSARRKKAKRQWLKQQAQLIREQQAKQLSGEGDDNKSASGKHNNQLSSVENCKVAESSQQVPNGTIVDGVVQVVVKPGHIRFQPLDEDADESPKQNQISVENFQWNGITSKRKGQKWGREGSCFSGRSDSNSLTQTHIQIPPVEESVPVNAQIELDKLAPYTCMPKVGDIVAYRLIELSSSWTPEVSSLRVGRVSFYNEGSKKISLQPVPEYPFPLDKKMDEETLELSDTSLYNEDGSLEIDFSALMDVRMVKQSDSKDTTAVSGGVNGCKDSMNTATISHPRETKVANVWDEVNDALIAKKAQLSDQNGWNIKESSGKGAWSRRALRGSALGPTMALLRSQNEI